MTELYDVFVMDDGSLANTYRPIMVSARDNARQAANRRINLVAGLVKPGPVETAIMAEIDAEMARVQ